MSNLISQNIEYNLDDVNDVEIKKVDDDKFELRIGDDSRTFKNKQDLKAYLSNELKAYKKIFGFSEDLAKAITPPEVMGVIHKQFEDVLRMFKAGAK